jgi:uncharacterized protein (DUF2147 family)
VNPSLPAMRAACAHDSVPRSSTSPKPCTSFSMLRLRSVQQTTCSAARARSLCACAVRSKITVGQSKSTTDPARTTATTRQLGDDKTRRRW